MMILYYDFGFYDMTILYYIFYMIIATIILILESVSEAKNHQSLSAAQSQFEDRLVD